MIKVARPELFPIEIILSNNKADLKTNKFLDKDSNNLLGNYLNFV